MINFSYLATLLSGPKGSGRTYQMIMSAPRWATVICVNKQHKKDIKYMSMKHGRRDLGQITIDDEIRALRGPFVIDHYTVEYLLIKADLIQSNYERELDQMRNHKHELEMFNYELLEKNKKLKEELNKND